MGIDEILLKIRTERYGRDVRQAIHDGIKQAYEDAIKNGNANMEVSQARGSYATLAARITSIVNALETKIAKGQVTMSDLTQEVKEALTGGAVAVVGEGAIDTSDKMVDGVITLPKIKQTDIQLWSPYKLEKAMREDEFLKNIIKGFDTQTITVHVGPGATYQWYKAADNVDGVDKLRLNYPQNGTGIQYFFDGTTTLTKQFRYGFWIKDGTWNALGSNDFRLGFRNGYDFYFSEAINITFKDQLGFRISKETNGIEVEVMSTAKENGWTFLEVILNGTIPTIARLNPIIQIGISKPTTIARYIDIRGLVAIDSYNHILPYFNYDKERPALIETDIYADYEGNLVGDSISAPSNGYGYYIEHINNTGHVYRHSIGGRPMANGTANGDGGNTFGKVWTDGKSIPYEDLLFSIIAHGTNDFKLNVPLGELKPIGSTFDTNTFIGAYQDLIEYILKRNPLINIMLSTPLHRDNGGYNSVDFVNTAGHKLIDYVDAIIKIGELYGLPVFDGYRNSGINYVNLMTLTDDGLHPNDNGYKIVGQRMANFFKTYVVNNLDFEVMNS